jgi:hypothetical protein
MEKNPMVSDVRANSETPMPAADVAQERAGSDGYRVLSTGWRAKLKPVSASLVDEVVQKITYPEVPMWLNPDKEREEPNPADPTYQRKVEDVNHQRGIAAMDAIIMFGIDLIDPVPLPTSADGTENPDYDGWIEKLEYMNIHFDATKRFHREFAFKKYIATTQDDIQAIMRLSGITPEEVERAGDSFRSPA